MKCFVAILNLYYWATLASASYLGINDTRPVPIDDLSKLNGTWEGYKKANVNLSLSCLSYYITCTTISQCNVTLIRTNPQDSGNTNYTIQKQDDGSIMVNNDLISINISVGTDTKYAIAWTSGDSDQQLVVLLRDKKTPDDKIDKEIDDTISTWNFPDGTVKKIDQSQCGTGNPITIYPASILLLAYFVIVSIS